LYNKLIINYLLDFQSQQTVKNINKFIPVYRVQKELYKYKKSGVK